MKNLNTKSIFVIAITAISAVLGAAIAVSNTKKKSYDKGYSDCEEHYTDWVDENIFLQNRVKKLSKMVEELKADERA
jgi:predicted metal-dependent HD superfamily phosphohydrolase